MRVCFWGVWNGVLSGVLFLVRKCRIELVPHVFGILLLLFINLFEFVGSVCLERHLI